MKKPPLLDLFFVFILCVFISPVLSQQDSLSVLQADSSIKRYAIEQMIQDSSTFYIKRYIYVFNKKLATEQSYRYGQKIGVYKAYFPGGALMHFGIYAQGKKDGEWAEYNEQGELTLKGVYSQDLKHGYWAYKKQGCYGRYRNGVKNGRWRCFDAKGKKRSVTKHKAEKVSKSKFSFKDLFR